MYRAALIGLGKIAWRLGRDDISGSSLCHRDAIDQNPKTELVCGYSPDEQECRGFTDETGLVTYTDLDSMLDSEKPDLISICSPNELHTSHMRSCIEHGIPMVWLEKPASDSAATIATLEEAEPIASGAMTVVVNYQRRYTACYQNLKRLIQEEAYGATRRVDIHYSKGLETNGSHMIDLLPFIFDITDHEILWVDTDTQIENPNAIVGLGHGIRAYINATDVDYHDIDISITCERGRLSVLHGGMDVRVEERVEHELFPGFYRLKDTDPKELGTPGFDHAFDKALKDLIDAHERHTGTMSDLSSARQGQSLIDEIRSHSEG